MRYFMVIVLVSLLIPANAGALQIGKLLSDAPNYRENSPFTVQDPSVHARLRNIAASAMRTASVKQCVIGSVLVWKARPTFKPTSDWRFNLYSNVCNKRAIGELRQAIAGLAPTLKQDNLAFYVSDLDGDGVPDLVVGYAEISKTYEYPYLSLWELKYAGGRYKATYAGSYLDGTVHAITDFGEDRGKKAVFVRHSSCIECDPNIFLTPIEFSGGEHVYEFNYSGKPDDFDTFIQYSFPNEGLTENTKVETRLLPPSKNGPHLLQLFDKQGGAKKWWAFTCKDYKCSYETYDVTLPKHLQMLWKNAKRL